MQSAVSVHIVAVFLVRSGDVDVEMGFFRKMNFTGFQQKHHIIVNVKHVPNRSLQPSPSSPLACVPRENAKLRNLSNNLQLEELVIKTEKS